MRRDIMITIVLPYSQITTSSEVLRGSLQSTVEDLTDENKELLGRLTSQNKELSELRRLKGDLEDKIAMQETLIQQLQTSSSSQPTSPTDHYSDKGSADKLDELEGEVSRLLANVQSVSRERDQAISDVAALREALLNTQQENARKVGQLQTLVKESEIEINTLTHQLSTNSTTAEMKDKEVVSLHYSLDSINKERNELKTKIQQLVSDNAQLSQLYSSAEDNISKLEAELSRLKEEVVDQQTLLATISQDKESISRAVAQNKDLKEQLAELQEAFVEKSQQNMDLATALESEKYQRQLLITQRQTDLEEARLKTTQSDQELKRSESMRQPETALDKEEEVPLVDTHKDQKEAEDTTSINPQATLDASQIQELSMECISLREERDKLLEELRRLSSPSSSIMDQEEDNSTSSLLQQSFSALQERFTSVMRDKADLLDRLQVMEHTIVQLSGENETIAEYVTLYQTQREALKVKFSEKDRAIEQLLQEKNSLQLKLREVQSMVSRLDHTPSLSLDLDPELQTSSNHQPTLPAHVSTDRGVVSQIVSLIEEELDYPTAPTTVVAQCPCCSGQLIVI